MKIFGRVFGSNKTTPARQEPSAARTSLRRQQAGRGALSAPFLNHGGWIAGRDDDSMLSKWVLDSSTPPSAYLHDQLDKLRARARWACQNDEIAASFLNKITRAVVGDKGFMPTNVSEKHAEAIAMHSRSANFCTDGRTSRAEFERLIVKHIVRDGEVFIVRHNNFAGGDQSRFALSIIDPAYLYTDRFSGAYDYKGNRVRLGVEVDNFGRAVAYHFRGRNNSSESLWTYWSGDIKRVSAENVLHLYTSDYADVNRGVSWLAPVLSTMEQLRRYRAIALKVARWGAKVAVSTENRAGDPVDGNTDIVPQGLAEESSTTEGDQPKHYVRDVETNELWAL